ncbi:hypothetical protein D1007_34677 [Hordeum vulgare]|uniref:Uncharacterized protein n=1 Tax=Hordeum vulgare subsp. vulgare TaxID=112509 RepID=A0A8I6WH83_HORVV|nr:uncharacterized protein LOC123406218 [Hordeum vulgare subsp. vulgare]KAE8790863.1 hypothetical protein D1007_34677 [Hordeum vulgare]
MAIDHDSPFKELRPKARRRRSSSMGDAGPEPEEEEVGEDEKSAEEEVEEDEESGEVGEEQEQAVSADGGERWPQWLRPMMSARFYTTCKTHPDSRRGGVRTVFCLDCAASGAGVGALCSLCADHDHRGHRVIRVRRSTYSSVLLVSDVRGLLDVDGVQTYVINGARVVFLRERGPQHKHGRNPRTFVNHCGCRRGLSDAFRFCSLGCKFPGCRHDRNACSQSSPPRNAADETSTPPPPPPAHRRKGIPHRAPFGNLIA